MTVIVMNTLNAAVTESTLAVQSVSPTHAGSTAGLLALGGTTDAGAPIAATFIGPRTAIANGLKVAVPFVYIGIQGAGDGLLRVSGQIAGSFEYSFPVRAGGISRAEPGRGLHENYLALGYRNQAGGDFRIDRIDADLAVSKKSRSAP